MRADGAPTAVEQGAAQPGVGADADCLHPSGPIQVQAEVVDVAGRVEGRGDDASQRNRHGVRGARAALDGLVHVQQVRPPVAGPERAHADVVGARLQSRPDEELCLSARMAVVVVVGLRLAGVVDAPDGVADQPRGADHQVGGLCQHQPVEVLGHGGVA